MFFFAKKQLHDFLINWETIAIVSIDYLDMIGGTISLTIPKLKLMDEGLVNPQ